MSFHLILGLSYERSSRSFVPIMLHECSFTGYTFSPPQLSDLTVNTVLKCPYKSVSCNSKSSADLLTYFFFLEYSLLPLALCNLLFFPATGSTHSVCCACSHVSAHALFCLSPGGWLMVPVPGCSQSLSCTITYQRRSRIIR